MRTDILKEMEISTQLLNADEVVFPRVVDIHPVNGRCNLNCAWCIGKKGYKKNDPLVDHFSIRGVDTIIENVLNPKYRKYWPLEFHICGCDSEPLLKSKETSYLIEVLKSKKRTVELITNGLLINIEHAKSLMLLDKLSISLDVITDEDYFLYKTNNTRGEKKGVTKTIENIEMISRLRNKEARNVSIYVTFVTTPRTFDPDKWREMFIKLKSVGVNHIQVRSDLNESFGSVIGLESKIKEIAEELNATELDYDSNDNFDIKYHSPDQSETSFEKCVAPYFWPAIGMDLKMYRCAHTTISVYQSFLDLKNTDFYEFYIKTKNKLCKEIDCIGCQKKCPPIINRFNYNCSQGEEYYENKRIRD